MSEQINDCNLGCHLEFLTMFPHDKWKIHNLKNYSAILDALLSFDGAKFMKEQLMILLYYTHVQKKQDSLLVLSIDIWFHLSLISRLYLKRSLSPTKQCVYFYCAIHSKQMDEISKFQVKIMTELLPIFHFSIRFIC